MSALTTCHNPGILLVVSHPRSMTYLRDFHSWYDTEHGPARLRLGRRYFRNGYRYRSVDDDRWLAIYDMDDLTAGADEKYTSLRENRSPREQDVLKNKIKVYSRQFFELLNQPIIPDTPAKTICVAIFKTSSTTGANPMQEAKLFSETLVQNHVSSRYRLFRLVDGTDLEAEKSSVTTICEFEHDLCSAEKEIIRHRYSRIATAPLGTSTQFYTFHRSFSAEEYITPPPVEAVVDESESKDKRGKL